jgi:hypothetical protein
MLTPKTAANARRQDILEIRGRQSRSQASNRLLIPDMCASAALWVTSPFILIIAVSCASAAGRLSCLPVASRTRMETEMALKKNIVEWRAILTGAIAVVAA